MPNFCLLATMPLNKMIFYLAFGNSTTHITIAISQVNPTYITLHSLAGSRYTYRISIHITLVS